MALHHDFYEGWLAELLGCLPPDEPLATCDDCAMVVPADEDPGGRTSFNPTTKCCTYRPFLPNFLLGRVLAGDGPVAHTARGLLEEPEAVTPLGLGRPAAYLERYRLKSDRFGRDPALRCPLYLPDEGHCGVWPLRNGICATWFCKHARGELGSRFWQTLRLLLVTVERELSWWCLLELGLPPEALERLLPLERAVYGESSAALADDGEETPDDVELWGAWAGEREALFRRCGELVAPLGWPEVARICGARVATLARLTRARLESLVAEPALPRRLRSAPFEVAAVEPNLLQVVTYSPHDPLELPLALLDVLPLFDQYPTAEALARLAEQGMDLPLDHLQLLLDYGVLAPAED